MKYLITGSGRCGTGYVAQVLTSAGHKCTHEGVFNLDGLEAARERIQKRQMNLWWGWEGDASWLAAPFLSDTCLKDIVIVHLVRKPKDVLDSMLRLGFPTHPQYFPFVNFGRDYIPEIDDWDSPADMAAQWYISLNKLIEPYADVRHRIEDDVCILLDKLGVDCQGKELFDDKQYNHREWGHSDVDLNSLAKPLRKKLRAMSKRYGYEWPQEPQAKPYHSSRWHRFLRKVGLERL